MSFYDLLYKSSAQQPATPFDSPGGQAMMEAARLAAKPLNSSTLPLITPITPQQQAAQQDPQQQPSEEAAMLDEAKGEMTTLQEDMGKLRLQNEQLKMQLSLEGKQQQAASQAQNEMLKLQLEREKLKTETAEQKSDLAKGMAEARADLATMQAKTVADAAEQEKKQMASTSPVSPATLANLRKALSGISGTKRADDLTSPGTKPEAKTQTAPLAPQPAQQTSQRLTTDTVPRLSTGEAVPHIPVEKTNWAPSAAQGAAQPSLMQMHSIYDTSPERVEQAFGGRDRSGDLYGEAKRYVTTSTDLSDMARSREQMANFVTKARETGAPQVEIDMAQNYVDKIDSKIKGVKGVGDYYSRGKANEGGIRDMWKERLNRYGDMYYKRDNIFGIGDTGSEADKLRNAWHTQQEDRQRANAGWVTKGLRSVGDFAMDPIRGMANTYMDSRQVGDMARRRGAQLNWFGANTGSDQALRSLGDAADVRGLSTNNWNYLGRGAGNAALLASSFIPGVGIAGRVGVGLAGAGTRALLDRGQNMMPAYYNDQTTLPGSRPFKYASLAYGPALPDQPRTNSTTAQIQNTYFPGMNLSIPSNPYASGFGKYLAMASPFIQSLTGGLITPVKAQQRANTLHERLPVEQMMADSQTAADPRFLPERVVNPAIDAETVQYNSRFPNAAQQVAGTVQHFAGA